LRSTAFLCIESRLLLDSYSPLAAVTFRTFSGNYQRRIRSPVHRRSLRDQFHSPLAIEFQREQQHLQSQKKTAGK
jgi:hypothetical protein